jgi:pimeloyl-ACP methyl ester carboxylesterase
MDVLGHGLSDKPRDGYTDSRLWADDINAAIEALGFDRPILCGWSYGPLIILDYLRHYGENSLRSLESLLRMCLAKAPSAADLYLMVGYKLSVPPLCPSGAVRSRARQRRPSSEYPQLRNFTSNL